MTVASGRSRATEWYNRAYAAAPAGDHVSVTGSKRSAARLAVVSSSLLAEPPLANTFPLGSMVALNWTRGNDIGAMRRHWGVACDRSIISAVGVADAPTLPLSAPPMIMTRGAYPVSGRRGNRTED